MTEDLLTLAERSGLDALCAAITAEIGTQDLWHGASDLEWIVGTALYQTARLIRSGHHLSLPYLGEFERRVSPRGTRRLAYRPDPLLLEDVL